MKVVEITTLAPSDNAWPPELHDRLKTSAPSLLWAIGNPEILTERKVGLFCSVRCPGNAILGAHDAARKLRDDRITVISGFHSPGEKECLRFLLRGKQPIIICLARALEKIRDGARGREEMPASISFRRRKKVQGLLPSMSSFKSCS